MWNLVYLLIATGIALLAACAMWQMRTVGPSAPSQRPRPQRRPGAAPNRARRADLAALAWEDPAPAPAALRGEALSARLRDRYIAARFPGLLAGAEDLRRTEPVIRCARLFFEEERYDLANELLHLATALSPGDEALRLAQLEIAFLQRNRQRFVALASQFRIAMPDSRNWTEIARLGRAVAPDEPMFAAGLGSRPHEHYGPWPDLPNWIQASWDLTAEVLAADFRRAMLRDRTRPPTDAEPQRFAFGD